MQWIASRIKWIMLLSGVLTCTMFYAAIDPQGALSSSFGATLEGPLAEIVVRNWGVLITLVGAMLIHGAFTPASRQLVLVVAGLSKLAFISLVLAFGRQYLGRAGIAVVFDACTAALFVAYLLHCRHHKIVV
jgi:hypothetical protein